MSKEQPRAEPLAVPREHGAWVMLAAGYLVGLVAGGRPGLAALLWAALVVIAFLARESLRRSAARPAARRKAAALAAGILHVPSRVVFKRVGWLETAFSALLVVAFALRRA